MNEILPVLIGVAIGAAGALAGWYFGGSRGLGKSIQDGVRNTLKTQLATIVLTAKLDRADRPIPRGRVLIDEILIRNFKHIEELRIDLAGRSDLGGNWTCIAGINGAGKSTILQAIC